jgi:two-component system alkaline phosphatase synthesis response regulator PhoP
MTPGMNNDRSGILGLAKRRINKMTKKILIIDDDPDLVEAVTMILESKKYEVAAAYGGIEGLQKAKSENPDLIVLDVMMPDKDGYAVCKELKANPTLSKIPVLLLTAVVSKIATTRYTQQGGLETEADDYIDKPVEPEVLVKRIEALLAKSLRAKGKEHRV